MTPGTDQQLQCSFCGKAQNDVRKLIAGRGANICDECIGVCVDIVGEKPSEAPLEAPQDEAGVTLSCALCRMPTSSNEAVVIPERGPLCPGCTGEFEAALARKRL